ncbi:MAG: YfhO family protein [Clostridiaceae bacterium]|nr:YfhO family protein [Clostridiaceae bacterium]
MPGFWIRFRDRIKQLLQQNTKTILAFTLPAMILFIGYMSRGMFPVADRDVLTIDLYHQYAPFMAELRDKFTSGGSLFYSWSGGLGNNFFALFAYYLASPLNIIIVLFSPTYLTEGIMILIVVKIGLAGACFFIFLRGVWRQENIYMVAISALYALSSFSLAYSWNIMWLDGIFLLPIILLGMVRLVREKRCLLYCVSLGLLIYSNYYIAFFVCLFTGLYFLACLFEYHRFSRPKALLATVGRFILFSVLGGGLSAVLSLPTYFSLQLTSAAGDSIPKTVTNYFDLFDYIGQHFMLTPPTIRDGMPNMYCGVLALILIPIYFFAKSIPLKQKLWNLALILVMILSFNINVLNFIWHGFHFPNQLPYRNSFVYIFLILTLAYPALQSLKEFSGKQIGAVCTTLIGIVLLAQKLNDKAPELQTLYVTIIFIVIYAAVLTLDRIRPIHKNDLAMALLFVVVAELLLNTLLTLHRIDKTEYYSNREGYMAGHEVDEIREQLAAIDAQEPDFYRLEILPPKTTNDPFMYQYNGLSIFSSTMPTKPVTMFANLGYHSNGINSYKYEGSDLLLDSLFGIKYIIRRSNSIQYQYLQSIVKTDELEVFRNPYALSLGYVGLPELEDWHSSGGDPFSAQNRLVTALTGGSDVLITLDMEPGTLSNMTFSGTGSHAYNYTRTNKDQDSLAKINIVNTADQNVSLYLDVAANKADYGYVMIDDKKIDFNAKRSTMVDLGYVSAGAVIELNLAFNKSSSETGRFELYAVGLDQIAFEEAITTIQNNSLQISAFTDTHVAGSVTAAQDGVMMMTIPYDKGWQVKVDGQVTETEALDNGFISFKISAGLHQIELNYTPEWFWVGLMISLLSIFILVAICRVPKIVARSRKRRPIVRPAEVSQESLAARLSTSLAETGEPADNGAADDMADNVADDRIDEPTAEPADDTDRIAPADQGSQSHLSDDDTLAGDEESGKDSENGGGI